MWTYLFHFPQISRSRIAGSYSKYMCEFVRETVNLLSKVATPFYISTGAVEGFNFTISSQYLLLSVFLMTILVSMMEKAMAPHSSTLAWKIPWMEEPGRLPSMGSQRVGHDWATSLSLFTFMHWRRQWQPTPVFLPGESQGRGSLVGCHLWGHTQSDTTEVT